MNGSTALDYRCQLNRPYSTSCHSHDKDSSNALVIEALAQC